MFPPKFGYTEFSIILVIPLLIAAFMSNALSNILILTDCVSEEVSEICSALSAELTFAISIADTSCTISYFLILFHKKLKKSSKNGPMVLYTDLTHTGGFAIIAP